MISSDKKDSFCSKQDQEAFFCSTCATTYAPSNRFILEKSMPHLYDILKEKGTCEIYDASQTYYLNFIILDLRTNKEAGYLPKSHLIEPSRLRKETIDQLVDEFARLKGLCHFVLITSKYNSRSPKKTRSVSHGELFGSLNNLTGQGSSCLYVY